MVVIPRSVGYLLIGIGLLVLAKWALAYLVTPAFFRPVGPQAMLVVAVVAAVIGLRRYRAG